MHNVNIDSYTDILLKTRERLTDPKNWCDRPGMKGEASCLWQTLVDVVGWHKERPDDLIQELCWLAGAQIRFIDKDQGFLNLGQWNDTHTHSRRSP